MQLGTYQHYKGNFYEVIGVAKHSETLENLVVYKALYHSDEFGDHALRVRPQIMFEDTVLVEGKQLPRFAFIHK